MTSRIHTWRAYLFAAAAAAAALLAAGAVSSVIEPERSPFFLAAVIVSAWYGGLGPGVFTTLVAVLAKGYSLFRPEGSYHGAESRKEGTQPNSGHEKQQQHRGGKSASPARIARRQERKVGEFGVIRRQPESRRPLDLNSA